jgi:hypothetical protein
MEKAAGLAAEMEAMFPNMYACLLYSALGIIITDTLRNNSTSTSTAQPNIEKSPETKKQLTLEQLRDAAEISQSRTFGVHIKS